MKIQEIVDNVTNQGVSLFEVGSYNIQINNHDKSHAVISKILVDTDLKTVVVVLK